MPEYSYIGKGKVFLAKRKDDKLRFVGNCDKVEMSFNEETKELKDFTQAGGGVVNSVSRIDKIEISLNLFDFSPENLSMAVYGESDTLASGHISGESVTAFKNHLLRLQRSHIKSAIVTDNVTGDVYQENRDYQVTNAGLWIPETTTIPNVTKVNVDYDYGATDVIQALMNSGDEYHLVFDGLNEAQSGKKVVLDVYRVKFTPAASLSFIGEDFGNIEMKGIALSDNNRTGSGVSRYFKVEMEPLYA